MTTIKDKIRAAKLAERTVSVCLNLDLQDEWERAERELQEEIGRPRDSLSDGGRRAELAERLEQLEAQMREDTVDFVLRAMPRPKWKKFNGLPEHQPRKDPETGDVLEADKYIGVNTETFFDDLVRASVVEPELDAEDWQLLLEEKLTDRQFDELSNAAWSLNRRDVDVPFSPAASRIRNSGTE